MTEEERLSRIQELERRLEEAERSLERGRHTSSHAVTIDEVRMPLNTLQGALDNVFSYPQLIVRKDGTHSFRTSASMIMKGDVVNGRHVRDPGFVMHEWDTVRFGPRQHILTWKE